MKKICTIFIIAFGLFAMISCNETTSNTTAQEPLRVGLDLRYPPFESITLDGDPVGISVDIANAFGEFLGREVEIVNTDFAVIIPSLNSGSIDIAIASMSITPEREEIVDFSEPYFYFKIISLLNKDFVTENSLTEDSTIQDVLAIDDVKYIGIASQVSTSIPESYGKSVISATDLGTAVESVAQSTADI